MKNSSLKVVPILRHDTNDIFESTPMRDYFEQFIHEYNYNFNAEITHRKVVGTEKISQEFEADLIKMGYLAQPICYMPETCVYDLSNVRTSGFDYNSYDLDQLLCDLNKVENIVSEWKKLAKDKKTIVFGAIIGYTCWVLYAIAVRSYVGIVVDGILVLSNLSIFLFDKGLFKNKSDRAV